MSNVNTIAKQIEAVMQGEPSLSFKDAAATELVRTIATLTPFELYKIGLMTVQLMLSQQLASAHAEREIQLMRDRSQPLC